MDPFAEAIDLLPRKYEEALKWHSAFEPEELRLRVGRRPSLLYAGREHFLDCETVGKDELIRVLERATGASLYNAAEAMRQGYFCVGALRIGICGRAAAGGGFGEYTSLCIRLAREHRGICAAAADRLGAGRFQNTLLVAPPGGGKTTALRELIRTLADRGRRIGVLDERGELSGGVFYLGLCSDVIAGMDKLSGALLLLRSMNPEIVAADEISAPEDLRAAEEVYGCGVGLLATAHAADREDLMRRSSYRRLIEKGIFTCLLVIRQNGKKRSYTLEAIS